MKAVFEFIISLAIVGLSATMSWMAWNDISYLFPVPQKWMHLDWWSAFCLVWLVRVLTGMMRTDATMIKMETKK